LELLFIGVKEFRFLKVLRVSKEIKVLNIK